MTLIERIAEETRTMPEQAQQQVLDFTLFLKQRAQEALESEVDVIISENIEAFTELAK